MKRAGGQRANANRWKCRRQSTLADEAMLVKPANSSASTEASATEPPGHLDGAIASLAGLLEIESGYSHSDVNLMWHRLRQSTKEPLCRATEVELPRLFTEVWIAATPLKPSAAAWEADVPVRDFPLALDSSAIFAAVHLAFRFVAFKILPQADVSKPKVFSRLLRLAVVLCLRVSVKVEEGYPLSDTWSRLIGHANHDAQPLPFFSLTKDDESTLRSWELQWMTESEGRWMMPTLLDFLPLLMDVVNVEDSARPTVASLAEAHFAMATMSNYQVLWQKPSVAAAICLHRALRLHGRHGCRMDLKRVKHFMERFLTFESRTKGKSITVPFADAYMPGVRVVPFRLDRLTHAEKAPRVFDQLVKDASSAFLGTKLISAIEWRYPSVRRERLFRNEHCRKRR